MTQSPLPAHIEAEQSLIGLLLWHTKPIPEVDALINHTSFYKEDHNRIYRAIQAVATDGDTLDPISIDAQLEHWGITQLNGLPTISYLYELLNREIELMSSPQEREQRAITYARLIADCKVSRLLITKAGDMITIAQSGSKDKLADAMALLQELERPSQQDDDKRFVRDDKGDLVLKDDTMWDIEEYPDPEYLVAKFLEMGAVSLFYGESGTGKSFIALMIAFCVAYGLSLWGRKTKKGRVLYFYLEAHRGLKKRSAAFLEYYALEKTLDIRFINVPIHLVYDKDHIMRKIAKYGDELPSLIVVDTFSNASSGVNQKNQEEVYPVLEVAHVIANSYGSHVLITHHDNKSGDFNGTKAFINHVDHMYEIVKGITKGSTIIHNKKIREEDGGEDISLQLHQVEIGFDPETFEKITSCVVLTSEAKTAKLPLAQLQLLETLYEAGKLRSQEWQNRCMKAYKMSEATWQRARRALITAEFINNPTNEDAGREYHVTSKGADILSDMEKSEGVSGVKIVSDTTDTSIEGRYQGVTTIRSDTLIPSNGYLKSDVQERVRTVI